MKRENYNSGWKHYKKGQQDTAFLVNLPHDAMQYEPRKRKMKLAGLNGGGAWVGGTQFGHRPPGGISTPGRSGSILTVMMTRCIRGGRCSSRKVRASSTGLESITW